MSVFGSLDAARARWQEMYLIASERGQDVRAGNYIAEVELAPGCGFALEDLAEPDEHLTMWGDKTRLTQAVNRIYPLPAAIPRMVHMRYVIVDLDGASRAYFNTRGEIRSYLQDLRDDDAGIIADLFVVAYAEDGQRVGGPQSAEELVESPVLDWSDVLPVAPSGSSLVAFVLGTQEKIRTSTRAVANAHQHAGASTPPRVVPA